MLRSRIFTPDDFAALQALDLAVQRRADPTFDTLDEREREGRLRTSLPALKFFERSEHSFLAEEEGQLMGVLLAQAIWQGDKPVVMVVQVLLAEGAPTGTAGGLLHACVKSAYDAAVYEVHFPVTPALESAAHTEEAHLLGRYAVSYLGSRHQTALGERQGPKPTTPSTDATTSDNG